LHVENKKVAVENSWNQLKTSCYSNSEYLGSCKNKLQKLALLMSYDYKLIYSPGQVV